MEQEKNMENEIIYPSIIFKIKDDLYSVNSKYVKTIMQIPKYKTIPNSNPMICGVFMLRELTVPMLDMRTAFEEETVKEECDSFDAMLEERKNDHINWVKTLRQCVLTGEKFTLTTDPNQCEFGRWYAKYNSQHNVVNAHLNQIEMPHEKLHKSAEIIEDLIANGEVDRANKLLETLENVYMPKIIKLLDEAETVFRDAYRQMVLVLSNDEDAIGMVVDEVVAVEKLEDVGGDETVRNFNNTDYIDGVKKSNKFEDIIIGLKDEKLLRLSKEFEGNKPLI